jgi:hypothetical protein
MQPEALEPMSDSDNREARRAARLGRAEGSGGGSSSRFSVVAHGENVVLVDVALGRSWALALDENHLVWQPIAFAGQAERAPRGAGARDDED